MKRPDLTVDFESHRDQVNRMTVQQLDAVSDIIIRMNNLDDASMSLLCDVLTSAVTRILRSVIDPDNNN